MDRIEKMVRNGLGILGIIGAGPLLALWHLRDILFR
jgi:hypothetical protein